MQIIENWQNKELYCMFCGTNKSVKYMVDVNVNGRKGTVCSCNGCAMVRDTTKIIKCLGDTDLYEQKGNIL